MLNSEANGDRKKPVNSKEIERILAERSESGLDNGEGLLVLSIFFDTCVNNSISS